MNDSVSQLDVLADLETRHDDLLRRLGELDRRVEKALAEWQPERQPGADHLQAARLQSSGGDPAVHPAG